MRAIPERYSLSSIQTQFPMNICTHCQKDFTLEAGLCFPHNLTCGKKMRETRMRVKVAFILFFHSSWCWMVSVSKLQEVVYHNLMSTTLQSKEFIASFFLPFLLSSHGYHDDVCVINQINASVSLTLRAPVSPCIFIWQLQIFESAGRGNLLCERAWLLQRCHWFAQNHIVFSGEKHRYLSSLLNFAGWCGVEVSTCHKSRLNPPLQPDQEAKK